jgi:RecA-family ATPase
LKKTEKPAPQDVSAAELVKMEIPPPKWAVPDIMPEGLTLLCGKPKRGKSMLALNLALAITNGGLALGHYPAVQGPVIYLALEDTLRRLKDRVVTMLSAGGVASENLKIYTDFPRMHQDGIAMLEKRIKYNTGTRLVVIDTLGKFRPPRMKNEIQYDYDYEVGSQLKALADRCQVCVLVVHHMRKTESEDKFDDVIGSFGVTGSADGIILLIRKTGQADAELHVTGRDIEENKLALKFDNELLSWNVIGSVTEVTGTERQQQVLTVLLESKFAMKPKEIALATGLSADYVRKTLIRLLKQGFVVKREYGLYEPLNI